MGCPVTRLIEIEFQLELEPFQSLLCLFFKLTLLYLDQIIGPLLISGVLFLAVLTNFIVRRK
jgi:hypothetical protein